MRNFACLSNCFRPWVASKLYSTIIFFSIAPTTLLALCLPLILNISADDSNLTNSPFGQEAAAVGFNLVFFSDDAFFFNRLTVRSWFATILGRVDIEMLDVVWLFLYVFKEKIRNKGRWCKSLPCCGFKYLEKINTWLIK